MQILNISVMNRPARFTTTTPYPIMLGESFTAGCSIPDSIVLRLIMKETVLVERVQASIDLPKPIVLRDILRSRTAPPEDITHELSIPNPIVLRSILKTRTIEPEEIGNFQLDFPNPIMRKRVLYDYTLQPEELTHALSIPSPIVRSG